ncbi:tRNA preQ1(34) S-adenosylmethionine ribosyltransferase-isomerase QueA, partial [Candidatus Omnitrophota bacterium]
FGVLAKPANKITRGSKVLFACGESYALVLDDLGMKKVVRFYGNGSADKFWQRFGQVPLPPYIKRSAEQIDKERYQTVYAQEEGAAAAPTAGLHFTQALLETIQGKGVVLSYVTLHVNYGTFAPVKSEDITQHKMHKEYFILLKKTADLVNATRSKGKKVFAVGTTSVRVLETQATDQGVSPGRGWTDLYLYPPYQFQAVDALITNFHFPKSTLLMLASAFAGKKLLFQAYQEAIREKYRFFSYGDAMLIL